MIGVFLSSVMSVHSTQEGLGGVVVGIVFVSGNSLEGFQGRRIGYFRAFDRYREDWENKLATFSILFFCGPKNTWLKKESKGASVMCLL